MKTHIHTVHEGHKDYKCEDYGKSFTAAQTQQRHIHIVHGGHKDHKCESCGKSFSQTHHLKKHIHTVHEGRKDLKCQSCGKSNYILNQDFWWIYFLQQEIWRHKLIHTVHDGRKDYKCESCGKLYAHASHLKTHTHTDHEGHKDFVKDHLLQKAAWRSTYA